MKDPNVGITVYCSICFNAFWSEDGYTICSKECEIELQRLQEY